MIIKQLTAKLSGCMPEKLADEKFLNQLIENISSEIKVTIVKRMSHFYNPGVSVVFLLAESHISIHTWPELGFADLDIVSCKGTSDVQKGLDMAVKALEPNKIEKNISEYIQEGASVKVPA